MIDNRFAFSSFSTFLEKLAMLKCFYVRSPQLAQRLARMKSC